MTLDGNMNSNIQIRVLITCILTRLLSLLQQTDTQQSYKSPNINRRPQSYPHGQTTADSGSRVHQQWSRLQRPTLG